MSRLLQIARPIVIAISALVCTAAASAQSASSSRPPGSADAVKAARTRAFHIIPVYHWQRTGLGFVPLTPAEKAELAWDQSVDRSTFITAVFAMGLAEATNTPGAWPGGWDGVGRRYGAALAGIGSTEFFSTFLLPTAFHQDPRYVGTVGKPVRSQIGYAVSRVLITRTDSGRSAFNFSQVFGNLASAALTDAYYPSRDRSLDRTLTRWGIKLAVGAGMNVTRQLLRPLLTHKPAAPSAP
jgi:hypothetical protein